MADKAAADQQYGPLNYRTAARTLFLKPYLAHFCSFFRRFFAVLSVLTPGFQKVALEDRGPVPQRSKTAEERVVAAELFLMDRYRCDNGQRGPPGSAELAAQLDYRPAFHFYPDTIESQDISGPIKINDTWHVFMDCVPEGCPALVQPVQDKPLSWCHFSSRDLVHWAEHPIAIAPDHAFGKT